MVKKWGILARPLTCKIKHLRHLMHCIARLHNFCITERLGERRRQQEEERTRNGVAGTARAEQGELLFQPDNVDFDAHAEHLRESAAEVEYDEAEILCENPHSQNRERMAKEIKSLQLTRPGANKRLHSARGRFN
jgi:hypothetical protein